MRREDRERGRPAIRRRAGGELAQDAAERVQVAAAIDRERVDRLGRHVVRGPGDRGGIRPARRERRGPGEPEVGHLGRAVAREQDIGRLQIAMDQPGPVSLREPGRDATPDRHDAVRRQRRLGRDQVCEVGTRHELHEQHGLAVDVDQPLDADQVGVADPGQEPCLGLEAPLRPVVGALAVVQDLAGPQPPIVAGHLHDPADRARAELPSDPVRHLPGIVAIQSIFAAA